MSEVGREKLLIDEKDCIQPSQKMQELYIEICRNCSKSCAQFPEISEIAESVHFQNEKLNIQLKDYYFSNVIARSSKTMIECNNSKLNLKSTGTEG